jgi:hypothetical protein
MGRTILGTAGSVVAGGLVAALVVVGVVNVRTSPGANPTDVTKPVTIDYGTNG